MRTPSLSLLAGLAAGVLLLAGPAAHAGDVAWAVRVATPGAQVVVANPAPVVYAPVTVYPAPAPVMLRPQPVLVREVVYTRPAPYPVYPAYWRHERREWREHEWREHHGHRGHHDR